MECTVLVAVSGSDMWSAVGYAGLVLGNRPIQQLTENVSGIEQDSISAIKQLAIQRPATP